MFHREFITRIGSPMLLLRQSFQLLGRRPNLLILWTVQGIILRSQKEFEKKIPYEEGLNQKLDDYVYLTFISNGMVRLIDLYLSADSPYQETLISEVSKLMQIITDPNIGSEQ